MERSPASPISPAAYSRIFLPSIRIVFSLMALALFSVILRSAIVLAVCAIDASSVSLRISCAILSMPAWVAASTPRRLRICSDSWPCATIFACISSSFSFAMFALTSLRLTFRSSSNSPASVRSLLSHAAWWVFSIFFFSSSTVRLAVSSLWPKLLSSNSLCTRVLSTSAWPWR